MFGRVGMASRTSTEKPQSPSTAARRRAQSPSRGESGTSVGFLESIFIRARASATASPRGIATVYLLFALPEALGLDFDAALTGCFLAAGFMVGFFPAGFLDRKSTRLNSSHLGISYAVFCLKKKK